jgi:uncharacterized membrane protein YeaQ/YmgE (transglycosylase-associated protein family)
VRDTRDHDPALWDHHSARCGHHLVWVVVGLVAGFLASRVMLGHGMGLFLDLLIGILGAILGGALANYFGVHVTITGPPLLSDIIIAFFGALILLLLLRLLGLGWRRRRAV